MYRIILACTSVPKSAGHTAATDITEEFKQRPWHSNATCIWDGSRLILQADNEFDVDGHALADEFSDVISSSVKDGFDGNIVIISITEL